MDRFEHGLPDPQEAEVYAYCAGCGGEIYVGQDAVTYGNDLCCNFRCLAELLGAVAITAGE